MKIGEFFVQLGAKGGEDLVKTISKIKDGMNGIKETSTKTKLAIIGAFYGLERMTSFSARSGASLSNFAKVTGMSTEALQRWQIAARAANVSTDSLEASFINAQKALGGHLTGNLISGAGLISSQVGIDFDRAYKDIEYLMGKLQQYAATTSDPITVRNDALRSFGLSDDVMAGMTSFAFTRDKMKGEIFSKKDIDDLAKLNSEFEKIYHNVKMLTSTIVREFAPSLQKIMSGLNEDIQGLISVISGKKGFFEHIKEGLSKNPLSYDNFHKSFADQTKKAVDQQNSMTVNQTLNFNSNEYDEPQKIGGAVKQSTQDAVKQFNDAVRQFNLGVTN